MHPAVRKHLKVIVLPPLTAQDIQVDRNRIFKYMISKNLLSPSSEVILSKKRDHQGRPSSPVSKFVHINLWKQMTYNNT